MTRDEIFAKVIEVLREVFDNEKLIIKENTVASDVEGWDSLMHITVIGTIEDEFGVKFAMKDVVGMKKVGDLVDLICSEMQ